jgi:ABC-type phosphate transport system substrate-binding protein
MRSLRSIISLFAAVALVAFAAPLQAQAFKVVAHEGVSDAELSADVLSKIFLKQSPKFPSGVAAKPVDLKKDSPVRAQFSTAVVGRPVTAVETYWQQQIFAGKEVPPPAKASDDEVLAFVRSTPGAIGYVSAGAATAGVKVITVK